LNCAGVGAVDVMRNPRHMRSVATNTIAPFLIVGGLIAGFLAIYLFIRSAGLVGLLYWGVSSFFFIFVGGNLPDGMRSILGLISLTIGLILFVHSL
jgi:hypothetical protein